ncbi:MAG: Stealth CR1 domain-containing protein [Chlamydiales bacterium]|nr:Stealth CR1 domain-containing protein [Chlamydiales bacterium]
MKRLRKIVIFLLSVLQFGSLAGVCTFKPASKNVGKVDIVYTWVDGADPVWQQQFLLAKKRHGQLPAEVCAKMRFRSRDELKYSLRSVWKYAPFINHIYIVTYNQRPSWLKDHPLISIIDHADIFYNKENLPTFNSQAIEANLHHIPNLQESYIYFNDDVFLGAPAKVSDFFSKSAKPKMFLASWTSPEGKVTPDDPSFEASWKNTNAFLNRLFGNKSRKALEHAPFAFKRSYQQTLEKCVPSVFKKVSGHAFRSFDDCLITAGLSQYFLENHGLAKLSHIQCQVIALKDNFRDNEESLLTIAKKRPRTFCIEDAMLEDSLEQDELLHRFFEAYFPEKAPWEY